MCGIAGIKTEKIVELKSILPRMMGCMSSRGPDSAGEYFTDGLCLGHLRLKIIDLSSAADQPMSNEDGNILIVYNGEIYNYQQLRRELEVRGHIFKSRCDTETIIHAYEEWGTECLARLRGMFAFAIWDAARNRLFLARDRLGIKPLYYMDRGGVFIFASQVRSILASGLAPKDLNRQGLESFLFFGGVKEPWTMVEGVYSLKPGHYLIYESGKAVIKKYWDAIRQAQARVGLDREEIAAEFKSLLTESIKLHLISDVELGIFLSGGIDSSSIVSVASGYTDRIRTVSMVFGEKRFDESNYSRSVACKYNTRHQELALTAEDVIDNIDSCLGAMDQPTFDGINTYFICRQAKKAGLVVSLSGLGADELFSAYPTFGYAFFLEKCALLNDSSPAWFKRMTASMFELSNDPRAAKILAFLEKDYPGKDPYFLTRLLFSGRQIRAILGIDKLYDTGVLAETENLDGLDSVNRISCLELTNYMSDILLRDTDFMSMSFPLEVRVPFLDHRLVEFMLSLPGNLKRDKRVPKRLLLESLDNPLPEAVWKRPKMGFVLPFDAWLRDSLKQKVQRSFEEDIPALDGIINKKAAWDVWNGFCAKRIYWQKPWAIYVLKKWLENYLL